PLVPSSSFLCLPYPVTADLYALSLHDALPICARMGVDVARPVPECLPGSAPAPAAPTARTRVASGPVPASRIGSVSAHHAHSTSPSPRYVDQVSTMDDPFTTKNPLQCSASSPAFA